MTSTRSCSFARAPWHLPARLGHRGSPVRAGRQPLDECLDLAGERLHLRDLVGLPGEPDRQVQRLRPLRDRGCPVPPAPGIPDGVVQQAGQPGRPRGPGEELGILALLGQPHLGELQGLVRRADGQVQRGAAPGRVDHLPVPAGRPGVQGHHGRIGAAGGEQGLERGLMQPSALPTEQLAGDRLPDQGMSKGELVLPGLGQDAAVDQLTQGADQLLLVRAGHLGEQVERETVTEYRRRLHDPLPRRVEVVDLPPECFGEVPRQRMLAQRVQILALVPAYQLLEEERVAAGPLVQRRHWPIRGGGAGDRGEQAGGLRLVEWLESEAGDVVAPLQLVQQRGDRVAAGHLGRPVRADEQQRPTLVGEPLEERRALRVDPMQVLEDDDRRPAARHGVRDRQTGVQPLYRTSRRVGEGVEEAVVDAGPPVDGIQQHLVRPGERPGIGVADQHDRLGGKAVQQLLDEPGLTDAWLAGDDRHPRAVGRREPREMAQLAIAAHHHRDGASTRCPPGARLPSGYGEVVMLASACAERPRCLLGVRRRSRRATVSRRCRSARLASSRCRSRMSTSPNSGWRSIFRLLRSSAMTPPSLAGGDRVPSAARIYLLPPWVPSRCSGASRHAQGCRGSWRCCRWAGAVVPRCLSPFRCPGLGVAVIGLCGAEVVAERGERGVGVVAAPDQ